MWWPYSDGPSKLPLVRVILLLANNGSLVLRCIDEYFVELGAGMVLQMLIHDD